MTPPTLMTLILGVLASLSAPALACPDPHPAEYPLFGRITLLGLIKVDPFVVSVKGGGPDALRDCHLEGEGLTGYAGDGFIAGQPDVTVQWMVGGPRLAFTVENEADTFLLIQDPRGAWHFDDNGRGQNPLVVLTQPPMGDYAVFVGAHGQEPVYVDPGRLIITETGP